MIFARLVLRPDHVQVYSAIMSTDAPWSDEPIDRVKLDRYGRGPFAKLLATSIDAVPLGSPSTVFGLVGRWGSGKSSVAAMVEELLPDTWIVQPFTPWAASGIAGLQLEFVTALDEALGGSRAEEQSARNALRKYVGWAAPLLASLPSVGGVVAGTVAAVTDEFTRRKPWSAEFEEMASSLTAMESRVLIVCDDIDRLDAVELLEFLKVVRLLGRFPNVHYLVAYDADTVEDLLAAEGISGRTSSFMEKIVQHPFELPQLDQATRWERASGSVNRAMDEQGIQLNETEMERYRRLIDALVEGLSTPRQMARYEQHLVALAKLVKGEVDLLDFAALAYLRLNHHEIYEALPSWARELGAGLPKEPGDKATGLTEAEWLNRIAKASRRSDIRGAWEIIVFLHPSLRAARVPVLHHQAFANGRYTERYYSLGVAVNDVSDVMVMRAISSLVARAPDRQAEESISDTLTRAHPSVARLAVEKLMAHRRKVLDVADPVASLVDFLLKHYILAEPTRHEPDSPADVLFDWLADEVLRGYTASEFNRATLLQKLGDERVLGVLLRISAFSGARDERVAAMLFDFAAHFSEALAEDGNAFLEPLGFLRLKLTLIERANGDESVVGILDEKVDGDIHAFESVAIAMVRTAHWSNGTTSRPEMEFESDVWRRVVSADVRQRMGQQLTSEFDSEQVDAGDVTDANRRRLAIATVRAELEPEQSAGAS